MTSSITTRQTRGQIDVEPEQPKAPSVPSTVRAYIALTKPRIIELLVIVAVPAMVLAHRGFPSPDILVATLLGGTLAAGGANAINNYFDRDIDEKMARTRRRPLPSKQIAPRNAFLFGVFLGVASFAFLAVTTNLVAASLALGALVFYVLIYTLFLKRRTAQNIVIGGAAGGFPALVGWAAVRGRLDPPALVIFLLVFYWTPPHFWALAIRYRSDYAAAGVPMLPVTKGVRYTAKQIVYYAWLTVATSLLLFVVGRLGVLYAVAAIGLGIELLRRCYSLERTAAASEQEDEANRKAMALFGFSNAYLAVLAAAVVADVLLSA
jgi:protoheme IX farnesyltransferase